MPKERYANSTATTLNGAINNSVTSLTVTDGSTMPLAYFRIVVESEIMFCTARSSNTLTVIRGQEGTTAASHADTVPVAHIITAGLLDAYRRDLLGAAGIIDTSVSLSVDDDDFDDESFSGSWTILQGTPNVTITERNHRASILIPNGSAAAQQYGFMKAKTPSSGDYVQAAFQTGGGSGQFPIPGVMLADGATYGSGNQMSFGYSLNENSFFLRHFTGYNTYGGHDVSGSSQNAYFWPTMHLRIRWISSDHYTCECSPDGVSWAVVFSNQSNSGMSSTPSYMGFNLTSWGSSRDLVTSVPYCRFSF